MLFLKNKKKQLVLIQNTLLGHTNNQPYKIMVIFFPLY